jgi:hypothetical protein
MIATKASRLLPFFELWFINHEFITTSEFVEGGEMFPNLYNAL